MQTLWMALYGLCCQALWPVCLIVAIPFGLLFVAAGYEHGRKFSADDRYVRTARSGDRLFRKLWHNGMQRDHDAEEGIEDRRQDASMLSMRAAGSGDCIALYKLLSGSRAGQF